MDNAEQTTQEQAQQTETPTPTQDTSTDANPQTDTTVAQEEAPTDEVNMTTADEDQSTTQQPEDAEAASVTPVTIGGVTVIEAITQTDILKQQGVLEINNPDGSKSQYSKEQAQARVAESQALVEQLGGLQ